MSKGIVLKRLGIVFAAVFFSSVAHAQAGVCKDPWITQAFHQMYQRAPIGSGTTGECDITRYGNGHWTSYQDLMTKIAIHGTGGRTLPAAPPQTTLVRPSPAPQPATTIAPRPSGNGLIGQDGNGLISDAGGNANSRNNNLIGQDGGGLIGNAGGAGRSVQSVDKPRAPSGKYLVIPGGNLVDANGNVVRRAGTYTLIVRNGAYAIGAGGRAPVAGTVVAP